MEGSIRGLLLLLDTYQFNLTDFSQGRIQIPKAQRTDLGITEKYIQDNPLSLADLHVLGQMSYNTFNLVQSAEILQAAEKRAQEENDMDRLKIIRSNLKSVIRQHDQLLLRYRYRQNSPAPLTNNWKVTDNSSVNFHDVFFFIFCQIIAKNEEKHVMEIYR